jgi:hypothetical protein
MAVNWNAFLTDEGLTLPDEQWSDYPTTTSTDLLSTMPKPTSGCRPGSELNDLTGFDPIFNNAAYNDTLYNPNDYFLSDLEVLQPFGDTLAGGETTDSSPEPTSGISLTGPFTQTDLSSHTPASTSTGLDQSPQMADIQQQRPSVQRAQTYPNPDYEAMFPNNMDTGFVEDLTFPNGPNGAVQAIKSVLENERRANEEDMTMKRSKNKPDIISACWTSPLCPNHGQDGEPPNPSSCGGGCAPFLFAPEETQHNSTMNNLMPEPQEVVAEDGVVEIHPRPRKRSESTSSSEPTGRQFRKPNAPIAEAKTRMKSEASEDPPPQAQPAAEDGKPKSRRRLPHNQVERKYRESLNTQLESLRRVVPALQQNQRVSDGADIEDLPAPSKPSKAVILASATAYIKQIEKENKTVQEENQNLRARIKALQALVKCEDCSLMQYVMDLKIHPNHMKTCVTD